MKKLLLIFLIPFVIKAQLVNLFSDKTINYFALDLDGGTEYAYINSPTGLDLNSANYLSGDNTAFTSTVGDWVGLDSVSGGKGFFTNTIKIAISDLSSSPIVGHNYTFQLKAKTGSSSPLKMKVGIDSTNKNTTTSEVTYAYTFTYHSGDSLELIGNGTDTYRIDDFYVGEAYDLEIDGWFNVSNISVTNYFLTLYIDNDNRIRIYSDVSNLNIIYENNNVVSGNSIINVSSILGTWIRYKLIINPLEMTAKNYVNDILLRTLSSIYIFNLRNWGSLTIGAQQDATNKFNGQIGTITFTRTNGLGEVTGTTIYDWKGTSDTFLDDKGTLGNDLTGVNTTIDDQVKYKGAYK